MYFIFLKIDGNFSLTAQTVNTINSTWFICSVMT